MTMNYLGGIEYDDEGRIISGAVLAGTYSVESLVIVDNNNYIDPSREEWEIDGDYEFGVRRTMIRDSLQSCSDDTQ